MNILDYLWKKEIRNAIREYRVKGTLNHSALLYLRKIARERLIIWFIIVTVFALILPIGHSWIYLLTFSSIPFIVKLLDLTLIKLPFLGGTLKKAHALRTYYEYHKGLTKAAKVIEFLLEEDCEKDIYSKPYYIKMHPHYDLKNDDDFERGDRFDVWFNENGKPCFPDIDYLKQKYSLTTEIL